MNDESRGPFRTPTRRCLLMPALIAALALATTGPAAANPPSWAPAYGYRAKHEHGHEHEHEHHDYQREGSYQAPPSIGIAQGQCNRKTVGALLGAAVGGAVGSQIGQGNGKLAATAAGTLFGFLIGGSIGQSMDNADRYCIGRTLEQAQDHHTVVWSNPGANEQYRLTPIKTYRSGGTWCRQYVTEVLMGGERRKTWGTACRQPDGSWRASN